MSQEIWLARRGHELVATDKDSAKAIEELGEGECQAFEPVGVRDVTAFRRYWVMCTLLAQHVRQIEIDKVNRQPVYMRIFSREDVSEAIKLGVGLFTTMPVASTEYAIRKVRSISYASMTPAKWKKYVKMVAPFVVKKVLPDVQDPGAADEVVKLLNKWLLEIEREAAQEQAA